jgi:DNA-binding MarR family transcriptional regulator
MDEVSGTERELGLLEEITRDPDTSQATLAAKLGVAVGTVNWHLKRLIAKGYVKVKRAERKKLRYFLTAEGIALRARLTIAYIENSMTLYRHTRDTARRLIDRARRRGYDGVRIEGDGDIADVCRLTCLEVGFPVVDGRHEGTVGVLEIHGYDIVLKDSEET